MSKSNPIKRAYDLYMSDLSFEEVERLIKRESADVYEFFARNIPRTEKQHNKLIRALLFARGLFNAFLLKMTPARRIFYLLAVLIFIIGYFNNTGSYLIFAFIVINLLLAFELADKLTTKNELDLARKIQTDLMPKKPPALENYEIAAYYESAREVGGDYYDIITSEKNGNKTYLVIGDISGKGMPAALYMVRVQAIIHSHINTYENVKEILINLNKDFSKKLLPEYFLTLTAAEMNSNNKIKICRAGHPPVLYFKSETGELKELNSKGLGIGFNDKGTFEKTMEEIEIEMKPDDLLFFYTDGITETMNSIKQQFGLERLKKIIKNTADKPVDQIKDNILKSVAEFRGEEPKFDDLTMILLKAK